MEKNSSPKSLSLTADRSAVQLLEPNKVQTAKGNLTDMQTANHQLLGFHFSLYYRYIMNIYSYRILRWIECIRRIPLEKPWLTISGKWISWSLCLGWSTYMYIWYIHIICLHRCKYTLYRYRKPQRHWLWLMAFRLQWLKPCQELMSWGPVGCLPLADLPCTGNKNKLRKVEVENLTNNIEPPFLGWVLHVCWLKVKVETWGISYMLDHPGKRRNNLNQWLFSEDPCQQPVDAVASDNSSTARQ